MTSAHMLRPIVHKPERLSVRVSIQHVFNVLWFVQLLWQLLCKEWNGISADTNCNSAC